LLVVDEAHLLTSEQLEQLRLLTSDRNRLAHAERGAAGGSADAGAPVAHGHLRGARSRIAVCVVDYMEQNYFQPLD
jgi:type II secretory pathway predicted ATPase ExeA